MFRIVRNKMLFAIEAALLESVWEDFIKDYRTSFFRVSKHLIVQVYRYLSVWLRCTWIKWS
jgi:hypothetical protein